MKKEFLKKNKYWITGATVIGVFASIFAVTLLADTKEAKAKEDAQAQTTAEIDAIYADMQALFTDNTYMYLSEDATMEQALDVEEGIAALEGADNLTTESAGKFNTVITQNNYAIQMIELRDMATALFNEDGTIKEGADISSVQAKADELKEVKPEFVAEVVQPMIDDANAQVAAIADAKAEAEVEAQAQVEAEEQEQEEYSSSTESSSSSSSSDGSNDSSSSSSSSSNSSSGSSSGSNDANEVNEGEDFIIEWDEDDLTDDNNDGHSSAEGEIKPIE